VRSDVRAAIKAGLAVAVPSATVYDYVPMEPGLPSPLIMLEVVSTERMPVTFQGTQRRHLVTVHLFVTLSDASYTESASQASLDAIEEAIGTWVSGASGAGLTWKSIKQAAPSVVDLVTTGGDVWRHEAIPLAVVEV